jgi:hypothetical protein
MTHAIVKDQVHFDSMQEPGHAIELKAPPEALRRAQSSLTDYAACFWMRQPAAPLLDRADVELVIRRLREMAMRRPGMPLVKFNCASNLFPVASAQVVGAESFAGKLRRRRHTIPCYC